MADLKTTYKDDLLDTSVNEKRKYNMIQNADGTVSFEDVTTYSQIGDSFGAADINATNKKVNEVNSNLTASNNQQFQFAYQDGKYGYIAESEGADTFFPFKKGDSQIPMWGFQTQHGSWTIKKLNENQYRMTLNNWTGYSPYLWFGFLLNFKNYKKITFSAVASYNCPLYYTYVNNSFNMALISSSISSLIAPPDTGTSIGTITTSPQTFSIDCESQTEDLFFILQMYSLGGMGYIDLFNFSFE